MLLNYVVLLHLYEQLNQLDQGSLWALPQPLCPVNEQRSERRYIALWECKIFPRWHLYCFPLSKFFRTYFLCFKFYMKLEEKHRALEAERSQCEARTRVCNHMWFLISWICDNDCLWILLNSNFKNFRRSKRLRSSSLGKAWLSKRILCPASTMRDLLWRLNSRRYWVAVLSSSS